jgi:hypothetical protein
VIPRKVLDRTCRELAPKLDGELAIRHGERTGFVLMIFDFTGTGQGHLAYVSNAQRDGMIGAVREWLARQEAGVTTDPLGPKVEA